MEVTLHLDTNAYGAFLRGDPDAVFILEHAATLMISPVVIGELKCGFALGARGRRNLEQLQEILGNARVAVPPIDDAVTSSYARIFKQLRADGHPIPTNDMWIAAAVQKDKAEALYTRDGHFSFIDGLQVAGSRDEFVRLFGL